MRASKNEDLAGSTEDGYTAHPLPDFRAAASPDIAATV
jgi:hypothetical protein